MTRVARQVADSSLYHVVFRGNGRQILFYSDADRCALLKMLKRVAEREGVLVLAWCLMGNHAHMVVCDERGRLSELMHSLLTGYARYFNQKYGHVGHVFQDRFSSYPIETDSYLLTVLRYVHLNPERAGLGRADEYRWSSYREYVDGTGEGVVSSREYVFDVVGGETGFRALCRSGEKRLGLEMIRCLGEGVHEDELSIFAQSVLEDAGMGCLGDVRLLDSAGRTRALRALRGAGLSIRQIERLTGVGRGVVSRVRVS